MARGTLLDARATAGRMEGEEVAPMLERMARPLRGLSNWHRVGHRRRLRRARRAGQAAPGLPERHRGSATRCTPCSSTSSSAAATAALLPRPAPRLLRRRGARGGRHLDRRRSSSSSALGAIAHRPDRLQGHCTTTRRERDVAGLHGLINIVATIGFGVSLLQRAGRRRTTPASGSCSSRTWSSAWAATSAATSSSSTATW